MSSKHTFIPYQPPKYQPDEMVSRSESFYQLMDKRRSIREFSEKDFPSEILHNIVLTASTAPSGAHKQPWTFCIISNAELKHKIRLLAEKEEEENYGSRMNDEWIEDLLPFGTDAIKEFIDVAPYLVIVFKKVYDLREDGSKRSNYYVNESVGIAVGFLLSAIHNAGLAALTHTPSPMNFLEKILERPVNERAYLLIPVGYPAEDSLVPDLDRRSLNEIMVKYE